MTFTDGLQSPPIFRRWAAIATIAGVLQRRVWTEIKTGACYTNLYVMLAGNPGTGKSLPIIETRKLWGAVRGLAIGPDNPTKPALIGRLARSARAFKNGKDEPTTFSSLAVPCEEFGVLITKYDNEFLSMLSHIWNNPDIYDVPRAQAESFVIEKPNMTIVAGVTPDALGTTFPEIAWGQGFTSRLIFVYADEMKFSNRDMFQKRKDVSATDLVSRLTAMFEIGGEMIWTPEAMDALIDWAEAGYPPVPDHNRLKFYNVRRRENTIKLAMIAAISAGEYSWVRAQDFARAKSWLLEAETFMPDVFRAMAQKSDLEEIAGLHFHINRLYGRRALADRHPIDDEILWLYLQGRVQSERIPRLIEAAERGGWIRRAPGFGPRPRWIPRPLNEVNTKLG